MRPLTIFLALYISPRGLTEPALAEWTKAHELNRAIPVLDASLGLALLHEKNDLQHALSAFQDGLKNDSHNVTVYLGADQALSLLGKPRGRARGNSLEISRPHERAFRTGFRTHP